MSRDGHRSASLFTWKPARAPIHSRVCNSVPTQSIPGQDEDWERMLLQGERVGIELLAPEHTWTDELVNTGYEAGAHNVKNTKALSGVEFSTRTGNAGDFNDFLDSCSPNSTVNVVHDTDVEEPYEYWEKAWSFSRSPFSNCSSLSFEDSDNEAVANTNGDMRTSCDDESNTREGSGPTPELSRCSDLTPESTTMAHGAAIFKGPTSI